MNSENNDGQDPNGKPKQKLKKFSRKYIISRQRKKKAKPEDDLAETEQPFNDDIRASNELHQQCMINAENFLLLQCGCKFIIGCRCIVPVRLCDKTEPP